MLCTKQIIGLVLFAILIIISLYIISSIRESLSSHNELQKPRKIHIPYAWRFPNATTHLGDNCSDIAIDLEFTFPHSTLTVGDIVDVSCNAIINPNIFQDLKSVLVSFNDARPYPDLPEFNEDGSANPPELSLIKSGYSRMTGNKKIYWPLEGKYGTTLQLEFNDKKKNSCNTKQITVYPKSEIAQNITNKAVLILTIAAYLLGLIGILKIIIDLLI